MKLCVNALAPLGAFPQVHHASDALHVVMLEDLTVMLRSHFSASSFSCSAQVLQCGARHVVARRDAVSTSHPKCRPQCAQAKCSIAWERGAMRKQIVHQ